MLLRGEAFSPSLQLVSSSSPSNVAVAVMGEEKEWEGQDGTVCGTAVNKEYSLIRVVSRLSGRIQA